MLIAIEGPNGIGKSTLIKTIEKNYEFIAKNDNKINFFKYPNKDTLNGEFIYKMLFNSSIDQTALATLFVNERYAVRKHLEKVKYSADIGVIDRYSPSNINSLLAKQIQLESRGNEPLFTTETWKTGYFMQWFSQISEYLVNEVIKKLTEFELLEQSLQITQPHKYVLLVPKHEFNTYEALYNRNFRDRNVDTHERFDQFVLSSMIYRECAKRKMFSNWSIIEINEHTRIDDVFEQFYASFLSLRWIKNNPCAEIILCNADQN